MTSEIADAPGQARIFFGGKNVDAGYNAFHAGPEFGGGGGLASGLLYGLNDLHLTVQLGVAALIVFIITSIVVVIFLLVLLCMICSGQLGGKRETEVMTTAQPYVIGETPDDYDGKGRRRWQGPQGTGEIGGISLERRDSPDTRRRHHSLTSLTSDESPRITSKQAKTPKGQPKHKKFEFPPSKISLRPVPDPVAETFKSRSKPPRTSTSSNELSLPRSLPFYEVPTAREPKQSYRQK